MTPQILVGAGLAALAIGALVLRSFGPAYRVGRLLSATPRVSVADAVEIAARGAGRYVRVDGRIDAEDEFEDEQRRPLVFRRERFEARRGGRWRLLDERRRAVDFGLRDGLEAIGVDHSALGIGLVVIARESTGAASEAADLLPTRLSSSAFVRVRVEQVSSVEHATALGVPHATEEGRTLLTAGAGRPLILTTLEVPEAMRVLAGGERIRPILAAIALAAGLALLGLGLGWTLIQALAAIGVPGTS